MVNKKSPGAYSWLEWADGSQVKDVAGTPVFTGSRVARVSSTSDVGTVVQLVDPKTVVVQWWDGGQEEVTSRDLRVKPQ